MALMFCQCSSLLNLDLFNYNTKNVTIFDFSWNNISFQMPQFFLKSKNNLSNMFAGCPPNLFKNIRTRDKNILEAIKDIEDDICFL